ncbi:Membrane-associated guanylate kinase, WW and PDZ domain-containing protein 1 [Bagarius yarrelli]|uniref:Membrane-associated guanylate kinase, WW and PDZ domain-containing protein 1 n=1 Tax=Bagarius yarrelli TaxID=175774 RepID=A0A556U1Y5_BAGYA|nr:Membrane-associated guanylate kinase, WW and PDZ domain-containing protein 1 [Bagarius yarrelli]
MSKNIQKRNHWSGRVNVCSLRRGRDGLLAVELSGGAERGQFTYISALRGDVVYQYGRLFEGDLLLEIEGLPVSGLPLYDVLALLENTKDPVRMKTVRQENKRFYHSTIRFSSTSFPFPPFFPSSSECPVGPTTPVVSCKRLLGNGYLTAGLAATE